MPPDRICALMADGVCVANTPEACLCRQMPELVYRRELERRFGPPPPRHTVTVHRRIALVQPSRRP